MTREGINLLILDAAKQHGLPWHLVHAVCQVESSFNPWAYRYEGHYRWLVGEPLSATEQVAQRMSWGLMQVMGAVAREYGMTGPLTTLLDPVTGLQYGCRHLARFFDRHRNWPDAISAYNRGAPRKYDDGRYLNQGYVDAVTLAWHALEQPTV